MTVEEVLVALDGPAGVADDDLELLLVAALVEKTATNQAVDLRSFEHLAGREVDAWPPSSWNALSTRLWARTVQLLN